MNSIVDTTAHSKSYSINYNNECIDDVKEENDFKYIHKNVPIFQIYNFPRRIIPKNGIFLIENFISENHCSELINIIDNYATYKEKWQENQNVNCDFIHVEDLKDKELKEKYDNIIFNYINYFINMLNNDYNISCTGDSGYCLRKIYGATRFHKDGISVNLFQDRFIPKRKVRNMSVIIALNGDYDGGTFHFPSQKFSIKLKKGQLIAFPPYWTHLHGVESSTNNTFRYTINTWLYE